MFNGFVCTLRKTHNHIKPKTSVSWGLTDFHVAFANSNSTSPFSKASILRLFLYRFAFHNDFRISQHALLGFQFSTTTGSFLCYMYPSHRYQLGLNPGFSNHQATFARFVRKVQKRCNYGINVLKKKDQLRFLRVAQHRPFTSACSFRTKVTSALHDARRHLKFLKGLNETV